MIRLVLSLFLVLAAVASSEPAAAQPATHGGHHSPHADQEPSGIAALSRQELDDLLAGAGMGLARPAELNQHPGPRHVLELAADLALTPEQRGAVEDVRRRMLDDARRLGREIVDAERHLDRRFAHRHIDEQTLRAATAEIAALRGELRFVHLRAHLETRGILDAAQIEAYDRLRGYAAADPTAVAPTAGVAGAGEATDAAAAEDLETSLERAERAFAETARRRDRDGFASFLTPGTVFATPHGNLRGPQAILAQWAGFFAPGGPTIGWQPQRVAVTGEGDVGLTSGPFWIETGGGDGATRFTGTFFSVWRRNADGTWKIVLDTGTDAQPEP